MLNTYLNDNQSMPYPFYGLGSLPFPMSVITGMGLCIKLPDDEEVNGVNRVYASNVQITTTSVNVAICRKTSANQPELLGMFYATTDGYYIYIPGYAEYFDDAVYEDELTPNVLRYVYYRNNPAATEDDTISEENSFLPIYELQVFYAFVVDTTAPNLSWTASTGYIQLGHIPENAVGNYTGEFYLDPSCVTYMPGSVYGYHKKMLIKDTEFDTKQKITLAANGLLRFQEEEDNLGIYETLEADEANFVEIPFSYRQQVTAINGYTIEGLPANPYPVLNITGQPGVVDFDCTGSTDLRCFVTGSTVAPSTDPVIIEVIGTDDFPNCYPKDDDVTTL